VADAIALPSADERWMTRALELARQSIGLASPNPVVGCVLVQGKRVVGEGFHEYEKKDHAEVVALAQASERSRGATAYVTLEPCSHYGRTGPCADALIRAGVRRVVIATVDPNPAVSGGGVEKLRAAGIEVEAGVLAEEARPLNYGFAKHIRTGLPFVSLKAALTLDGRIAPPPGDRTVAAPVWITSEESRQAVQQMRHASDALITGINTVLDDDPLLTDRTGLPRRRPLLRVVLDSALRLRLDSQLVRTAENDVLVFCTSPLTDRARTMEALGVRVERIEAAQGSSRVSLKRALEFLGGLQMTSVMIEAGAQVNTKALAQGLVDRLDLFYGPTFLGATGVPFLHGLAEDLPRIHRISVRKLGPDIAVEGWLRDPWQ
jgi:diaminohydroxyphosphoribosylaminopyrimidine deaminase / 5-amino-6-(5-phosphoribosylamino)uracil reductase